MSVLDDVTKKVTDTAKAAAKKSGEFIEITKLNISISGEETKIEKLLIDIGKLVYEEYKNGEDVGEINRELCQTIDEFEENKKEMKEKILDLKNLTICPKCGKEADDSDDVVFCSKCGEKL